MINLVQRPHGIEHFTSVQHILPGSAGKQLLPLRLALASLQFRHGASRWRLRASFSLLLVLHMLFVRLANHFDIIIIFWQLNAFEGGVRRRLALAVTRGIGNVVDLEWLVLQILLWRVDRW